MIFRVTVITGCREVFSKRMKKDNQSLRLLYDRICSNIYNQLLFIEKIHPVKQIHVDLMMEQSVVCGLLGYYEFLTPQRLESVLQWQRTSGCFGVIDTEMTSQQDSRHTMRKLLMKKQLPGEISRENNCKFLGTNDIINDFYFFP